MRYPVETTGLWGEAVRQRKPIVTNNYSAANPSRKGYPKGHVHIERHMNIPVFEKGKIVAVAGVGNKDDEYNESDVRQLCLHMDGMWATIRRWKDAEEQKLLRNYLSNIVNSMPSQLIAIDINDNITQWNTEAQINTGVTQEEALGQPLNKVLPDLEPIMQYVRSAINNETIQMVPKKRRIVADEERYEDIIIYPLTANSVNGAVIRIDDVTERVRLEKIMMQSEKMMSLGGIAAGMAHEINTPLACVIGFCHNMRKRIFADLPKNKKIAEECGVSLEQVRNYLRRRDVLSMLNTILEMGNRINTIVSNILGFSRINSGEFKEYDLAKLLDDMISLAANNYNSQENYDFRNIEIVREYEQLLPPVLCNGNELQQVFLNLLNNGAQAMAEKIYNTDHPRFICRLKKDEDMAIIEIEDNGTGMNKKTQKRIFEPFFTTKSADKGTGLGLSVSNFIVKDHHKGQMYVESEPDKWTRFTIKLPLVSRPQL